MGGKRYGEEHPRSVLTDREIEMIRELYEADRLLPKPQRFWTPSRLADKFGVSRRSITYYLSDGRRSLSAEQAKLLGE